MKNFSTSSRNTGVTGEATDVAETVLGLELVQLAQRRVLQVLGADFQVDEDLLHVLAQLLGDFFALGLVFEHHDEFVVQHHHVHQVLLVQTRLVLPRLPQQVPGRVPRARWLAREFRLLQGPVGRGQLRRFDLDGVSEQHDSVQTFEIRQLVDDFGFLVSARQIELEVSWIRPASGDALSLGVF